MIGFKLTPEQAMLLMGKQFAPNRHFNPVPDINGNYFIFRNEVMLLENQEFNWVNYLPLAEYIAPLNTL